MRTGPISARKTGRLRIGGGGVGTSAVVDHRLGRRRATAVQRRRLGVDRVQRRNLQLPRTAADLGIAGPSVPHRQRHRNHRASLRGIRHRLPGPSAGHVRLCDLGRAETPAVFGQGPVGAKAVVLPPGSRSVVVRERTQIAARKSPMLREQLNPRALDAYLLYQYVPYPMCMLEGYHKLPPAHFAVYENGNLTTAAIGSRLMKMSSPPMRTSASRKRLGRSSAGSGNSGRR